jgi:hypothetical protein
LDLTDALLETQKSEPPVTARLRDVEAVPIVEDEQFESRQAAAQGYARLIRARVFRHILQSFLSHSIETQGHLGRDAVNALIGSEAYRNVVLGAELRAPAVESRDQTRVSQNSRMQFVRKVTHFISQVEKLLLELGHGFVDFRRIGCKPSLDVTQRD